MVRPRRLKLNPFQRYKGGSGSGGSGAGGGGGGGAEEAAPPTGNHDAIPADTNQLAERLGVSAATAEEYKQAIDAYTGPNSWEIRANQMDGEPDRRADLVQEYIQKAPKFSGTLYRGLNWEDESSVRSFIQNNKVGSTMSLSAMSSFSSSLGTARGFATDGSGGSAGIILKVKGNRSAASVRNLSRERDQQEVIAPQGTQYRVTSLGKDKKSGMTIMNLEEI